jgi:hypothetical protein
MSVAEILKDNTVPADYDSDQPAWIRCDCCDECLCTIHEEHAGDCSCPPIDVWSLYGKSPYIDTHLFRVGELLPDPSGYPDMDWPEELGEED